ncbi:TPA: DUF2569 domain-containing protein [Providencia rettgeri]|uniref:DUF2569 domain-containing protein n=1 Tax=Providencia TaxID=586 RepID=UPI001B9948FD|nr:MULTISPECIES: DUF2569 domain-containing protein [Providencia]EMB5787318.1 DUF2569 domain-containing protein [Providencia rettgeri]MDK7745004.1 DUF2569 domain-containing protein [Providencia rettgeri]MDK7757504.1 DUF2569 domain-containing protein [Providencia rettgeri]HBC7431026.1 DUF2569 domain-containing protein [Providencia rettgeri]
MKTESHSSSHGTSVPSSQPRQELTGIGGWLILPMLGIVLSLIILPFSIYEQNVQVIEYWIELTDPQSSSFIPLFKELIYFEVLGNVILYATLLFLSYVFFTKKKLTIKIYIFFQIFSLVLTVTDIILASILLDLEVEASDIKDIFRALIACAIWIPYFLVSRRVKNTFVN